MLGAGARTHFDEDQGAVTFAEDQVDLGAACVRTARHPR
jgi:hypothetical protein